MAALGTIGLQANPTPVTVASYGASTTAVPSGTIGLQANPVRYILSGNYAIAGTQQKTRTVPTFGQLWPRGDANW